MCALYVYRVNTDAFFNWYHCLVSLSRIALIKAEVLVLNSTSNSLYIEHCIFYVQMFLSLEIPI